MAAIVPDDEIFSQFTEDSRKQYRRMWAQLKDYLSAFDFESGPPGEEDFNNFFKFLRMEKKFASSSLWTWYSCLDVDGQKESTVEVFVDETFEMEEDPEMYQAAGLPLPCSSSGDSSFSVEKTVQQAISSLPELDGKNITVKVCFVNQNHGTINMTM